MGLLWMFLERLTGLHSNHIDKHATYTNFILIPAILIYVFALLDKRKHFYNGKMTYKQGLITGLILTGIITLLSPLTQVISTYLVSPAYFTNVIKYTVENAKMTQIEAENYFNLKNYIFQGLIGAPIMGIITTLIVSIFTKNMKAPSNKVYS